MRHSPKPNAGVVSAVGVLVLIVFAGASWAGSLQSIEVFTAARYGHNDEGHWEGATVRVYYVDRFDRWRKEVDALLPKDRRQAEQVARRIISERRDVLQEQVRLAFEARQRARKYEVQSVPSVVINGAYLIEGTADVGRAVAEWRRRWGGR